ncbi:peptide chain release factor N(5)-glutamine methyltransferase [Hydrogenophaga sp.]|uniref:peptide chain release factor N(5)-glutamine methyltransferase n=1 Tax=Hydrogenophaga sp. TaxID=1904254 RepID=UPI00261CDE4D|nr:peptide chain release factor N(5)-glutamine methyltransferase [Hydrogenophaga sp.]MDM7949270.1 peptide chain release factor N(5)-glutamine methyltransferase [Hydrogenophaga sp.]
MKAAPTPTLADALRDAQTQGLARLDAQMLLLMALAHDPHDRAWLLAHDGDVLSPDVASRFRSGVLERLAGVPMAYLTGEQAFFGLTLQVDRRVLVPRPDTEILVEWALRLMNDLPAPTQVLDLGTGSGAVALAMKSQRPVASVWATDVSEDALTVARANAARLGLTVHFAHGSWLDAVPGQRFHLIVSNPPYIAEGDPHLPALAHEPLRALTAGMDGLDDIRSVVGGAPSALHPGGWLLLEHGHDQAKLVRDLLHAHGFDAVASRNDLAGIARCTGGRWPGRR